MAESNPTQVILTDDGIKIIKAQNTADSAASGVTDLNDPNLMSVIEKQYNISQFAGLTSQYNVIVQSARDDGIDTTAVTVAYNNLNTFMAGVLADPNHASDVDRVTYKKYQDAYNEELANIQNALQNNANNKFTSAASATSQAASTANIAKSAADSAYAYANSEIAVQSNATAKAQSTADNAFSQAQAVGIQVSAEISNNSTATAKAQSTADTAFSQATTAIDNGQATSQAVTALKDGSTMTIAELQNGLATKVANSEYASYKDQTASQIGEMVTNGAFSAYKQTTADLISSKVATSDFSSYKDQTATAIDSKVESKDFNTYKTQTADLIDAKVSSSEYASDKTQTASQIANMVSNSAFSTYQNQTASQIASKVDNGDFSTYKTQTANLIAQKVATSDFSSYKDQTATAIDSKVESSDFNTYKTQTADAISSKVESSNFQALQTQVNNSSVGTNLLLGTSGILQTVTNASWYNNNLPAITPVVSTVDSDTTYTARVWISPASHDMSIQIAWTDSSGTTHYEGGNVISAGKYGYSTYTRTIKSGSTIKYVTIVFTTPQSTASTVSYKEMKFEKGSVATDYSVNPEDTATQSQITQLSGEIDLRVKKGDLISDINAQAGNILISASHQLTLSSNTIYFDTANPVIIPSANIDKLLVDKKLTAADISANTFSTNNKTFTVDQNGAITAKNMTLIGGTLTSPTINASTINGATLNMQTDGLINSPYTGIQQTADQFYHPWKLNTGQLTIGQGYITSVSSGTRSINGVPKQFNSLQGTLSASYLKFTNDYGARTYIDADMFTYSNQTNDTAMVAISASGVGINMGTMSAPALTISNGYIDASSSSSYGKFGAMTLGYNPHTINSDGSLFFESGLGSGNPGINIWAKGFQSLSSRLSTKRQVRLLDDEHSNSLLLGADTATFQYNQDTNADNSNEGVIIDDVNTAKQYNLPDELITRDGKAPTDLMSFIARVISQNKYQARLIEDLQIRLRKFEINNEQ